jgi:hypothetical protein
MALCFGSLLLLSCSSTREPCASNQAGCAASDSTGNSDSGDKGDTGEVVEVWPEPGGCGALASPFVLDTDMGEFASEASPHWALFDVLDHTNTAPSGDDGDCPTYESTPTDHVDAGAGCTNDSGTELAGRYELTSQHLDAIAWAQWDYFGWSVDYDDADGFVSTYANGRIRHQWLPSAALDHQLAYRVHSGGSWATSLGDTKVIEDLTSYRDEAFESWSGYAYVLEAPWTDGFGDYCVEVEWDWSGGCELEPDGELLLEADHDYRWVLDGSVVCDGCGSLFVDGVESGVACL